jgi:hypothetical protein
MFVRSQFFRFLSVQILKNCSVLSWNWKWRNISSVRFGRHSNYWQPPWGFWRGVRVLVRRIHVCNDSRGWRFENFVVMCDFTNNKNPTVKLGMLIVNALIQLQLKFYIIKVFIVECSISVKLII